MNCCLVGHRSLQLFIFLSVSDVATIADVVLELNAFSLAVLFLCAEQKDASELTLEPEASYPGHQLQGGEVLLSPHLKWLASYAPDGYVMLRTIGSMVSVCETVGVDVHVHACVCIGMGLHEYACMCVSCMHVCACVCVCVCVCKENEKKNCCIAFCV